MLEVNRLLLPFLVLLLLFSLFWVYALYRVLTDEFLDKTNKIIWVVAISVAPLIGCIL
ncbi:MAG: PLDc N-terminal domain-containing protein [Saprospiraceae bacterium]